MAFAEVVFHPELTLLPQVLMDKLICMKCNNILSVYPIYSVPDGNAICGRCIDLTKPEGIRNNIYETLSELISFPCMNYQYGCMKNLTGNKMRDHELKCAYRKINCPSTSCNWIGETENLLKHFQENHARNLMKEPSFEVVFVKNYEEICLLPYAGNLFLVKKRGDVQLKLFWCSIKTIFAKENEKFEYIITLRNPSNGVKIELPKKSADSLTDVDGLEINYSDVWRNLKNPITVIATINIVEFESQITEPMIVSSCLSEKDLEMLKIIECPVCYEYMVPPIFQCSGGHSICNECKIKVQQCPTCRRSFGDTQNYAIESFTSLLKYPCKNADKGCQHIAPVTEIKQHEKMCVFCSYLCPTSEILRCEWSGTSQDIWNHCKNNHSELIMENPLFYIPFGSEDEQHHQTVYKVLNFLEKSFMSFWIYNPVNQKFIWVVQLVGSPEESKNYYFDLEILDRSNRNLKILVRCPCRPFSTLNIINDDLGWSVILNYDQVKAMMDDIFCFKIKIHKKNNNL